MAEITKKLTNVTLANSLSSSNSDKVFINQANTVKQVRLSKIVDETAEVLVPTLKSQLGGITTDGVFVLAIMYEVGLKAYSLDEWDMLKNVDGVTAQGVLVAQGGHYLCVALTEWADTQWSLKNGMVTGQVPYAYYAINDFNGEEHTYSIVNSSTFSSAASMAANNAPKLCRTYQTGAIDAGRWWLPSIAELVFIMSNKTKINECLSHIDGAKPITDSDYWTSSESSSSTAYTVNCHFSFCSAAKTQPMGVTRPVTFALNLME